MTGLPLMSSRLKPACLARERWPNERRSSLPNQRWLRRSDGVSRRAGHAVASRRARATGASCAIWLASRGETNGGMGPAGAMPASSVPWCSTRAGPHSSRRSSNGMNWLRIASACAQSCALARREERAAQRRGDAAGSGREARQVEVAHVHDRRTLADAAHHAAAIDAPQQAVEIRVVLRLVADHRVLDGDRDAVAHQPADRIEPRLFVRAEAVFGLQIEDQRHAGGVGNLANARLEARRIARVAARQHHRRPERVPPHQPGLIDRPAERGPEARNRPARRREHGEPAEQGFELVERDVVEEGVAAVEQAGDAAGLDVPRHAFRRVEVERALGVALARAAAGRRKRRRGRIDIDRAHGAGHCKYGSVRGASGQHSADQHLLRAGPHPRHARGAPPPRLPAPRFARRRWLEATGRLDQQSDRAGQLKADPSG